MTAPVKFELAKLLKEKGFEIFTAFEYTDSGKLVERRNCAQNRLCSAPTIAEVAMWLYEKHGLWTNVVYMGFELKYSWSIDIVTTSGSHWDSYGEEGDICYNSPTEAYEAAILYTLNNLI